MDKTSNSSSSSSSTDCNTTTNGASTKDKQQYLMHLNKLSHKISKPPIRKPTYNLQNQQVVEDQLHPQQPHEQQQNQPPVYNINKSDFREVVQKLTGSPGFSTPPPPIQPPKPPSSRLHKIRPPPLPQLTHRPPTVLAQNINPSSVQPLSPLPPFPAVHAAAESPISAYMRYLHSSTIAPERWSSNFAELMPPPPPLPEQQQQQQNNPPSAGVQFPTVPSGCMQSPRSPYALLSPSLLLSPNNQFGFQTSPLSPTFPVPSSISKGH